MIATKRLFLLSVALGLSLGSAHAANRLVERGKYLVTVISCSDCHTPGTFLGHPDMNRFLGGSDVGFEVPGLGIFYGPNLTPDKDTGLGKWSVKQIATAITTGQTPDGHKLAPPMPVQSFSHLSKSDALAIASYLKTLKPVKNQVPGPFGPGQKPTSFVYQVIPADKYVPTPAPGSSPRPAPMPPAAAPKVVSPSPPAPPPAPGK